MQHLKGKETWYTEKPRKSWKFVKFLINGDLVYIYLHSWACFSTGLNLDFQEASTQQHSPAPLQEPEVGSTKSAVKGSKVRSFGWNLGYQVACPHPCSQSDWHFSLPFSQLLFSHIGKMWLFVWNTALMLTNSSVWSACGPGPQSQTFMEALWMRI